MGGGFQLRRLGEPKAVRVSAALRRRGRTAGKLFLFGVIPTAMLLCGAQGAAAQDASGRKLDFQVIGRVVYDSNSARGASPLATVRKLQQDDILYSPSARIDAALPIGRQAVFVNGAVGYDFRQNNKQLNRERIDVSAGVAGSAGPCGLTATGSFSRSQSDIADLIAEVTKNTEQRVSYGLQGNCGIGAGLSVNLGGTHSRSTNSAEGQGLVSSTSEGLSGGINYGNRTLGVLGLVASYSTSGYDDRPGMPLQSDGFNSYSAGVNYSRPIGTRLQGQLSLFYSQTQQKGPLEDQFTGLTGSGTLTYRATSRLRATLGYQRGVSATNQQGSSYSLSQSVQLNLGYALTSRIRTSIGARGYKRDYRGGGMPPPSQISNERGYSIFGSTSLSLGRDMSLALDASRDVRNTNLTVFDYRGYRVGLSATKSF